MKIKSKALLVLLTGAVLIYAGCKKSSTTPVATVEPKVIASEVAVNISQSLFGNLGAFDLSGGLSAPSSFALRTKGSNFSMRSIPKWSPLSLHTNGSSFSLTRNGKGFLTVSNPECGAVIDTTVNASETSDGFTISLAGEIKFTINCTNNVVSGFTNVDNVTIGIGTADTSFTYKVGENLTVSAVNPLDPNTNILLNGTLNSQATYQIKSGPLKGSGSVTFSYTLSSILIDQNLGVVSGSATFNTTASGPEGTWNYSGTITFLGNSMAKIVISGVTYTVNLDTGATS